MMKKKIIATTFLLFANFIILVHAVVPHHHHYVGLDSHDCCSSSEVISFTHIDNNCSHDEEEKDGCLLQDLLFKLVLNTKEREMFVAAIEADFQDFYVADLSVVLFETTDIEDINFKPYILKLPIAEYHSPTQLRAPPCC